MVEPSFRAKATKESRDGFTPGLPDGIFAYQKSKFGHILEGLGMENVGIILGYLVYFMGIWYICTVLVCCTMKNLATLFHSRNHLFRFDEGAIL
jgi:hypothetical protein